MPGGHEILNPDRKSIFITRHSLRRLDMENFLYRDKGSGLLAFKPKLAGLYLQMHQDNELGPDFSGPSACVCRCRDCQRKISDIDHTRLPGRNALQDEQTDRIVAAAKAKRKSN